MRLVPKSLPRCLFPHSLLDRKFGVSDLAEGCNPCGPQLTPGLQDAHPWSGERTGCALELPPPPPPLPQREGACQAHLTPLWKQDTPGEAGSPPTPETPELWLLGPVCLGLVMLLVEARPLLLSWCSLCQRDGSVLSPHLCFCLLTFKQSVP